MIRASIVAAFALLLLPVSLLPGFLNMTGNWYLTAALLLGAFFLRAAVRVARDRTLPNARLVLKASVIYLPLLYVALVLDRHVSL